MNLHHVSGKEVTEIHAHGNWGSFLFFSEDDFAYDYGESTHKYTLAVDADDVCDSTEIFDYEESDAEDVQDVVDAFAEEWEIDEDEARECISEQSMPSTLDSMDTDAFVEAAIQIQLNAAKIAVLIGFAGVVVADDVGDSVMIDMSVRFQDLKKA